MADLDLDRPPVPPKDHNHIRRMMSDHLSSPPPSTSKRKRDEYIQDEDLIRDEEYDGHTPKRSKAINGNTQSSGDVSSKPGSKLRRKKGVHNLSSVNLRHQAEEQEYASKFQEGSLTDRPSNKPPSVFLRQGNLQTDTLMDDYHNGMPTPRASVDTSHHTPASSDGFLSRIGRRIAAFPPIAIWNKVYAENKEELTQKNIAEIKRKMRLKAEAEEQARLKAEAEARYQEMKKTGEIPSKTVASARDSGVEMLDDRNYSSMGSYAAASTEGSFDDTPVNRTLRSRLSFIRRPSLNNLRFDLKRPKSELNLHGAARESSSSISPLKTDDVLLKKSPSKVDLRRQQKLSKRVSDLEGKLQLARQELNEALVQASPMPKLNSKHTWSDSTFKKNKFVPGMLPSLPSERLLDPAIINGFGTTDRVENHGIAALDEDDEYDDNTIKASSRRAYPALSASLFDREDKIQDVPNLMVTQPRPDSAHDQHAIEQDQHLNDAHGEEGEIEIHLAAEPEVTTRRRKRKSGESDKAYRPDEDAEDDIDENDGNPKHKKHKSSKNVTTTVKKSQAKKTKQHNAEHVESSDVGDLAAYEPEETVAEEEERHESIRDSIDSTAHSLEPVYEEEEDSVAVPLNEAPKQPTALATPARFGRTRLPKAKAAKAGAEEAIITRAARAVQQHPARQASTRNAKKNQDFEWPEDVF